MKYIALLLLMFSLLTSKVNATVLNYGSKTGVQYIVPYTYDTFWESFVGGANGGVTIIGDGNADLDLYIYDQNGNTICTSTSAGSYEYCAFNPKWTGPFKIVVKNQGLYSSNYRITTY